MLVCVFGVTSHADRYQVPHSSRLVECELRIRIVYLQLVKVLRSQTTKTSSYEALGKGSIVRDLSAQGTYLLYCLTGPLEPTRVNESHDSVCGCLFDISEIN